MAKTKKGLFQNMLQPDTGIILKKVESTVQKIWDFYTKIERSRQSVMQLSHKMLICLGYMMIYNMR